MARIQSILLDATVAVIVSTATTLLIMKLNEYTSNRKKEKKESLSAVPTTKVFKTKHEVAEELCKMVAEAAKKEINAKGSFSIAVAGGSLIDSLAGLVNYKSSLDWGKVKLGFVNHKCIKLDKDKATVAKVKTVFADAVGIKDLILPTASPAEGSDGGAEAKYYATVLSKAGLPMTNTQYGVETPVFDMVLLGLGADGHVGSNHPNSATVQTTDAIVVPSPKDSEPSSITLSIPSINAAKQKVFVVTGGKDGKKEAVKQAMIRPFEGERGSFPAQLIDGPLFLLDSEAAADL